MKFIKHFWGLFLTIALIFFFHYSWSVLPPLGKLFSPFEGFMQNAVDVSPEQDAQLDIPGLLDEVIIKYDDNAVPHIFAKNDHDLYLAQGYVVARDRLWQMEFYTLLSSGRLTEVVGKDVLEFDRYNRKLGMAHTAGEIVDKLESDSLSSSILNAYAAGVNAYIRSLDKRSLPIEYKILDYKPELWSPYKSILMLMNLRNTLNGGSNDYRLTNVAAKYGMEVVHDLFPDYPSVESPIVPAGTEWGFDPLPVPSAPDAIMALQSQEQLTMHIPEPSPEIGSNNWAVAGSRSATGLPILANDPHLQLSLPSIWYQIQLTTSDMNVYGVSLPGTPAVVIGFNKDIAWGVTNVGSDVMDFYSITYEDGTRKRYWHDGEWKPVEVRVETFKLKNGKTITDTLYSTHHGPILYDTDSTSNYNKNVPVGHAMRWVGHETQGSEILALHYLNRARDYDDYRHALQYYTAPAQNFVFSSNEGDIAITSNGRLPLKWKWQGRFILDGSSAAHDWQGWIPFEHNPTVKNPAQGFVSSANQFPADTTYPYYLDWRFAHSSRAIRINERLAAMEGATADSLNSLLNDNFNVDARRILPVLLTSLSKHDTISRRPEYQALADWDYGNDAEAVGASIFEHWMDELLGAIWEDDFSRTDRLLYPSLDRTWALLEENPAAAWFDKEETEDVVETLDDAVRQSFEAAIHKLEQAHGGFNADHWAWGKVKATRIMHLVPSFPSFGRTGIVNGGGRNIVNATSGTHGPSWRMVVQLDKNWPTAYGLYPGGQSGNPASPYYDNMIDKWAKGELDRLLFLKNEGEESAKLTHKLTLKPSR